MNVLLWVLQVALACHMANEAYFRRAAVTWDEASKTIK